MTEESRNLLAFQCSPPAAGEVLEDESQVPWDGLCGSVHAGQDPAPARQRGHCVQRQVRPALQGAVHASPQMPHCMANGESPSGMPLEGGRALNVALSDAQESTVVPVLLHGI